MITFDSADRKLLDTLDKEWLEPADVKHLEEIILKCDAELRRTIAESLINTEPTDSWPLLQMLTQDKEFLVRAEACQSLSVNCSKCSFDLLLNVCTNDPDSIVRAYAMGSVAEILKAQTEEDVKKAVKIFKQMKQDSKDSRIHLAICEVLYKVYGETNLLEEIAGYFEDLDYRIRCTALNHMIYLLTTQNKDFIHERIMELKQKECSRAVQSTIERFEEKYKSLETV